MARKLTTIQVARILAIFIRYADEKGSIERLNELFQELGKIFPNGNVLEGYLYELNQQGSIYYEEIGEDGFKPIILAGTTPKTAERLTVLLSRADDDLESMDGRIKDILSFNPDRLRSEISDAEAQLVDAKAKVKANEMLRPLLSQIETIEKHFRGVAAVAERYEEVYKNIIRPVQLEGQSGVKATVRWAIYSIIASTLLSIAIGNWKDIVAIFHPTADHATSPAVQRSP
ncbi:hypothetical protein [Massilia suwonensis]|uniref:Uncharacterized protein n=1 Tax=Massilia suwonensis TaxID=648895 RepID=A0ABW0MEB9_9BURK